MNYYYYYYFILIFFKCHVDKETTICFSSCKLLSITIISLFLRNPDSFFLCTPSLHLGGLIALPVEEKGLAFPCYDMLWQLVSMTWIYIRMLHSYNQRVFELFTKEEFLNEYWITWRLSEHTHEHLGSR